MDRATILRAFLLGIPSAILGLLPLAFPDLALWLLGALVTLWVVALVAWQAERILGLQKGLRERDQREKSESTFAKLDEIKLFLEGPQATRSFALREGDTIHVSVTGKKRFTVALAKPLPRGKFEHLHEIPETREWRGRWDIESDGEYVVLVEPAGASPFWVDVKIEKERKAGVIVADW